MAIMFKVGDRYRAARDIILVEKFYEGLSSAMPTMLEKGTLATMTDAGEGKDAFILHIHERSGSGFALRVKRVVFGNDWTKV